jgi:8-oxo-dGTP pyrophosphatase MutT (NUDIX family)
MKLTIQPSYLAAVDPNELKALELQWGAFPIQQERLVVDDPFLTDVNQRLVTTRRRAEICYIMHRGDPSSGLLLHIKTFYPEGAYRLPTGGIHPGEQVMETLAREIEEETGQRVGDGVNNVQVQRCLGMLSYTLDHRTLRETFAFATYHFLVKMPRDGVIAPLDPDESIGGWKWCKAEELLSVAAYLEQVGRAHPEWADWGLFRGLSHRFVANQLKGSRS